MIFRLTCSVMFAFLWLLFIKGKICHALDPQRYPPGLTPTEAQTKCGTFGLVHDPLVLTKMSELYGREVWTGQVIFTQLSPWIEIVGCVFLRTQQARVFKRSSPGYCEKKCSTEYFGLSGKDSCICFGIKDIQLNSTLNISPCKTSNDETVLLYKVYNGTIKRHNTKHGLCSTLTCTKPDVLDEEPCIADSKIQSLCENGMRSSLGQYWGIPQNQSLKNCWNQNRLLLNSSACQYFEHNLTSPTWTNVFREEIEVEQTIGDRPEIPNVCLSAIISKSDTGEYVLKQQRRDCSAKLEWFVCKNGTDSTRIDNKSKENEETASNHGTLIGGSVGVVIVLLIVVSLIVCKTRRIGLFKSNNSANTTTVIFTKSVYDDNSNLGLHTHQQVNESYGLADQTKEKNNERNNSYAQVQKVKSTEAIYSESANGEYDHLHNIGERQLNASENTYDSNAGVRNRNDPTYDTATSSTKVNIDNTYDHSFTNLKTYSEYDVSDSGLRIDRTDYDVYNLAC